MRESYIFYKSFADALNNLDDVTRLQCYDAITKYAITGEMPEVSGVALSIFSLIKPQIDANNKRYESGKKGGRKANDNQEETKGEPKANQTETKTEPKVNQKQTEGEPNENVNVNDNGNDNVNENVNENEKGNGVNTPPTPPTGGAPTPKKPKPTIKEQNESLFDKLIPAYSMTQELTDKARDWITYKGERKEPYTEQGMKSLLTQIASNEREYGIDAVISVINESMSNTYKGIVWERLKRSGNLPRASGSAYLDRIDNRYKIIDDWLEGKDDEGGIFTTGEGIEVDVSRSKIHSG